MSRPMHASSGRGAPRAQTLDVDMELSAGGMANGDCSPPPSGSARPRKPSYIARKEEKARLLEEVAHLQRKLMQLQQAQAPETAAPSLLERELAASLLRDAVRMQQLSLVHVQSAVSGYVSVQTAAPYETPISLGKDAHQRRDTLVGVKSRTLRSAVAYLEERARFLDPFLPFTEASRFMLESGDYCVLRLDMTPFESPHVTVHEVFSAVQRYVSTMDVRVTDMLGDITTRDEADYSMDGIQQVRCVSHLSCGVLSESNTILSSELVDCSDKHADGGPFAVLTADFVDRDELYPYDPSGRVRQDITAVITVRSHSRRRMDAGTGREENETVVVMTRSCFLKLHRTDMAIPPMIQHQLRDQLGRWTDVLLSSVIEHVHAHGAG